MNYERLTQLADLLERTPADKFDLCHWKCGTTACAVGTACLDPEFQKLGLSLVPTSRGVSAILTPAYDCGDRSPPLRGWSAVREFFGLTDMEARCLFQPSFYTEPFPAPRAVADRIRDLLEQP